MLLILCCDWSSNNTYSHNIVRDALVVVTWAVFSSILAACVLGMASVQVTITDVTITGH